MKYEIYAKQIFSRVIEVEAEDWDEAREKVLQTLKDEPFTDEDKEVLELSIW